MFFIVHGCLEASKYSDEKEAKCYPKVQCCSVGERYGALMSPEDIARLCWGTMWACNVAQGC